MCLTCGCLLAYDDHENSDRLTMEDLEKSATLDHVSLAEAVANIVATVEATNPPPGTARLFTGSPQLSRRRRL